MTAFRDSTVHQPPRPASYVVRRRVFAWGSEGTHTLRRWAMKSFIADVPRASLFALGMALLVGGAGCGPRMTPPGAASIGTSAPGMSIQFLRWNEGLLVLFVDDVKGSH